MKAKHRRVPGIVKFSLRPRRLTVAIAGIVLSEMAGHAYAQTPATPVDTTQQSPQPAAQDTSGDGATLPKVTVTAQRDPVAEALNPKTTVGSKIPVTAREVPQSVSVIPQERIQEQHFDSLKEAMNYAPGVTVFQSDSSRTQYYARGFPVGSFLIDGTPTIFNNSMSSSATTFSPDLALYENVELLTGPSGLFNGFGSPGGAINLVRKHAQKEFTATAELTGGTRGNNGATIDVGGPLNAAGTLRGRVVGSYTGADGVQDSTHSRSKVLYGTIEADVTDTTLVRAGISYQDRTTSDPWLWPVYTNGTHGDLPVDHYYGAGWNKDRYSSTDVFAEVHQKLAGGWSAKAVFDYQYDRSSILQSNIVGGIDPTTFIGNMAATNNHAAESKYNFDLSAAGPYQLFGRTHQAVIGLNYAKMNDMNKQNFGPDGDDFFIQPVDVRNINYPLPNWLNLPTDTDVLHTYTRQFGFYGQTKISITDPLSLIVGGRVSWYQSKLSPDSVFNYDGYTPYSLNNSGKFTGYAGLVYDLNSQYSVYASYTSIFQPQDDTLTADGKMIKPITGSQYEAGIKGEFGGGRLDASLAVFQIDQKNRAATDPNNPDFSIALGKARSRGVELTTNGEVLPGWRMFASYTYTDAQLLDQDSFDSISSPFGSIAPKHTVKLWTSYQFPSVLHGLTIGGGLTAYSPTTAVRYGITVNQGTYAVADASLSYAFTKKTSLSLNANNLFNRDYFAGAYSRGFQRTVLLTLRTGF
ncbi:TonB-dependent siderophore receptor [Caballeronia sp. DA-9]|uniref:TonB-dependent siderophore receptor n=1 Tax=Caballeronia sp. DA-9 TaxID=3436237 RepID=UPI003F670FAE